MQTQIHTNTNTYKHKYIQTQIHTNTNTYRYKYIQIQIHTDTNIYRYKHKHKHKHIHKHIHIHIHIHMHTIFTYIGLFHWFLQEIITEWQTSASNLLVVLGINFSQEVMAEMLQKITPGSLPHYFVVLTLANLAKENGMNRFHIFSFC